MNDEFGDRMKLFESLETSQRFMPMLPIVIRLDGRSFSAYTNGLEQPFDMAFRKAMVETTKKARRGNQCGYGLYSIRRDNPYSL